MASKGQIRSVESIDQFKAGFGRQFPEWNVSDGRFSEWLDCLHPADDRIIFSLPEWLASKKFETDERLFQADLKRETDKAFLVECVFPLPGAWNMDLLAYEAWIPKSQIDFIVERC